MRLFPWILLLFMGANANLPWNVLPMKDRGVPVGAVAISDEFFAVGLARDGVRLYEKKTKTVDSVNLADFGVRRRINDLAWWRSWLIIASESGLTLWDARRRQVVAHLSATKLGFSNPGVFSLVVRGSDLWVGGLGQVAQVNLEQKKVQATWIMPAKSGRAQSMLALGSALYVGTEGAGVQVLDLPRGSWKGFDQFDGLPSNQITGLELVGTRIIVGTAQGLGRIDIPTQSASILDTNLVVTYMAQANGAILLTSLDGLWSLDGSLVKLQKVELQKGLVVQGDLAVFGAELVTGSESSGVVRIGWKVRVLTPKPPVVMPQGVLFTIYPAMLAKQDLLAVRMWYPERATAEILLETIPGTSAEERLVRLPADAVGYFVLEIGVFRGKESIERKTYQIYRDRTLPMLEMEGIPLYTKESTLKVRGRVMEQSTLAISVEPLGPKVNVSATGEMEVGIPLTLGLNTWEIVVRDRSGNELRYPMQIILDRDAPQLKWTGPDTVSTAQATWRIPIVEPNLRRVSLDPNSQQSVLATTDSMLLLTLQNLTPGLNELSLLAEDEAGNITKLPLKIVYWDERTRIVQSMNTSQPEKVVVKRDTVYRCTTSCASSPVSSDIVKPNTQIQYRLRYGETLRSVADKFYGNRELYVVLAEFNGILDPEDWYKLPVGKAIVIPVWQDLEHGDRKTESLLESFHQKVKP